MKSFEIITTIKDGRFARNTNRIAEVLRAFEGKTLTLTLKVVRKERSIKQNNYYWGVIVVIWQKLIKEEWGEVYTMKEVHEFLKYSCNYIERVKHSTGEIIRFPKSTTENSTVEQEEFHEAARNLAEEMFGVTIPLPEEQIKIEL